MICHKQKPTNDMDAVETFYERLGRPLGDLSLLRRRQDVLLDKKWKIFFCQAHLFRFLPFVDGALAAGSMALGNVHESSDFDVIVVCRNGRIFTARAWCILFFSLFGKRRKKLTHKEEASNMICLNHFVTRNSFCLAPPHNLYWQELYKNLVPVYGGDVTIQEFFEANSWADREKYIGDIRHKQKSSLFKKAIELMLGGAFGNVLERGFRQMQLRRIKNNLAKESGFEPRLKVSDEELEFHPDTKRIYSLLADVL